ncbi:MBL fold metallo-hydrolase [Sporosarcina sp. CAU 1771]
MTEVLLKKNCATYPIILPTRLGNLGTTNFFLFKEGDSLSLIDAGFDTDECWEGLNRTLISNGFTLTDIDRIILTHHHSDHTGLVNRITNSQEIPVYAPALSIPRLKRDEKFLSERIDFFEQLYNEMGCGAAGNEHIQKLKRSKDENHKHRIHADVIPLVGFDNIVSLQVIETPGHSPDHLVFFDQESKWLFGGDLLLSRISSNAIVEPDQQFNRLPTLVQYINSLQTCLLLDVEVVFPGHGPLIYDHKKLITTRLDKINEKAGRILKLIESGISTANDLAKSYYGYKYATEFGLVISEIIGHLDYLEVTNKIGKKVENGIWYYFVLE